MTVWTFSPSRAVWHYLGALEPAVAATLRLPPPKHPDAPTTTHPAPLTLFVASHEQRPMTVNQAGTCEGFKESRFLLIDSSPRAWRNKPT